jgi:hypothetical protein
MKNVEMRVYNKVESICSLVIKLDSLRKELCVFEEKGFNKFAKEVSKILKKYNVEDLEEQYEIEIALYDFFYNILSEKDFYSILNKLTNSKLKSL